MFKGIDLEFKQKLKNFNEKSKFFAFNCSDLERGDYSEESKKFYIYSEELRQKIAKIIHDRQQPGENIPTPQSIFFHLPALYQSYFKSYVWWFIFSKDSLYKMAKKGVEQRKKGFLIYDREGDQTSTLSLSFVSRSIGEKEQKIEKELEEKMEQICDSIINEINQAIIETDICLSELEINYVEILPDHCQCEVEVNLDGSLKDPALFVFHVYDCLRRNERGLIDFKNEMLEQIQQGQINFNNYFNSIIQEIKVLCAEKRVSEDSFCRYWYWKDWKESLRNSKSSRERLQKTKNDLIKLIEVEAEFNDKKLRLQAEADKAAKKAAEWKILFQQYDAKYHAKAKEKQKKLRRQAKTESKQLKREEEEKQQDKTEKRANQKQAEKLKKEKEERIRQQQEEQLKNQQEERERQEHQILILS